MSTISFYNEETQKYEEIPMGGADASNVSYDNSESELEADNVQEAIDKISANIKVGTISGMTDEYGQIKNPYDSEGYCPICAINARYVLLIGDKFSMTRVVDVVSNEKITIVKNQEININVVFVKVR